MAYRDDSVFDDECQAEKKLINYSAPPRKLKKFGYSIGGIYNRLNEKRQIALKNRDRRKG